MRRIFKKSAIFILVIGLFFVATGCKGTSDDKNNGTKSAEEFETFLQELPALWIDETSIERNLLFNHSEKFGIKAGLMELPYSTKEDYQETAAEYQTLLDKFYTYDYNDLSDERKLDYDILVDYIQKSKAMLNFYYLDNNYLGAFLGFQAQLPIVLSEIDINTKMDLDGYFNVLKTSKSTFKKYAENEQQRQDQGFGWSKEMIAEIIKQNENFIKEDNIFLIEEMNKKIDAAPFLNDVEKIQAKKDNEAYLKNDFLGAYKELANDLANIKVNDTTSKDNHSAEKKQYYEALLKSNIGVDMSVVEIQDYLNEKSQEYIKKAQKAYLKYGDELQDSETYVYSNFTSAEENIEYLSEAIKEDFPEIGQVNYEVKKVPAAMEENFSPAAYIISKIDAKPTDMQTILINGPYNQNLFPTIAHESYPGHMYQDVYAKSLELPTVRHLVSNKGYAEGWGHYVENYASKYALQNADKLKGVTYLYALRDIALIRADIGIHYEGWTYDEYTSFMQKNFGIKEDDPAMKQQYYYFLEAPTNYLAYNLIGLLYQDLYDKAEKEMGSTFDAKEFHKVILNIPDAPYSIVEQQVQQYIDKHK